MAKDQLHIHVCSIHPEEEVRVALGLSHGLLGSIRGILRRLRQLIGLPTYREFLEPSTIYPTFPISTLQGLPQSATELPDIAGYQSTVVIMSARLVVIDYFSS